MSIRLAIRKLRRFLKGSGGSPGGVRDTVDPHALVDLDRWKKNATKAPSWIGRNEVVAKHIPNGSHLLDVGAGSQNLRDYLPPGCTYEAADVVTELPGTHYCDFNSDSIPAFQKEFDLVVCSGVLEYVLDPMVLLRAVGRWAPRILLTYAITDKRSDVTSRRRNGWYNHLSLAELTLLSKEAGLTMETLDIWDGHLICSLTRDEIAPIPPPYNLINIFRADPKNIGDWHCAPHRYFPELGPRYADLFDIRSPITFDADLIIGGGGLLNPGFETYFNNLTLQKGRRLIGWGLGENSVCDTETGFVENVDFGISPFLNRFDLLGIRDWGTPVRWVPCASCLNPLFDKERTATREIVVFQHKRVEIKIPRIPKMTNNGSDLEAALDFLGSARCVITNSYHGAYWATLLGCRVVAFPFSTKFYRMKHPPVLCRPENWAAAVKESRAYPEALRECRDANNDFAADVARLLAPNE